MNITVACVLKSGGCYTAEYVERLKGGVDANLRGHEFVCLSDMDVPCERIPLETDLHGWYAKLELFRDRTRLIGVYEMTIAYVPPRPVPPPSRVEYKMPFWMFLGPEDEFAEWLREPWWRKLLGITTHDKRARKPVVEL